LYATALQDDDLLESIAIPAQSPNERSCVLELARRHGDFATAAVMARGQVENGALKHFAIVFFAVGDLPLCDKELDKSIQQIIDGGDLSQIPDVVKTALMKQNLRADLYSNQKTKLHLCSVLARRAVEKLLEI
jgi:carbon-monoxide dehydrogenase medium subunit